MKVLHYCKTFSKLSETFIYDYVTGLEELGIENYVVTHGCVNNKDRPFEKVAVVDYPGRWHPERLIRRIGTKIKKEEAKLASWAIIRKGLKKVIQKIKPDIIHAQFGPQGVLIAPVAKKMNIPFVVTYHGYDVSRLIQEDFWIDSYNKWFKSISAFIGVSNHICEKLQKLGAPNNKIHLIHNGIDLSKFKARKSYKSDGKISFCFIGRFVEKKAPILLIKSYQHYLNNYSESNSELIMIGDGPLFMKAKNFVQENRLDDYVQFVGAISHDKIPEYLEMTDIYVQHSITASNGDQEGMGVSLAEASAYGIPVITTNHNGFPDVVKSGETGFLVQEGSYKIMGKKMGILSNSESLRKQFGKNARRHMEDQFDMENQLLKHIEILKKVANEYN